MWFNRVKSDLSCLPDALSHFETEYQAAQHEVKIHGVLEQNMAKLPGQFEYRYAQLQEVEAILEYINIQRQKEYMSKFKYYLEGYQRRMSASDAKIYADGDAAVVAWTEMENEVALVRNKFLSITKSMEMKQWQLGHCTKLRVAGIEDARF